MRQNRIDAVSDERSSRLECDTENEEGGYKRSYPKSLKQGIAYMRGYTTKSIPIPRISVLTNSSADEKI